MNGPGLTPFALVFMTVSMASVTLLVAYCYWRILMGDRRPDEETDDRPG